MTLDRVEEAAILECLREVHSNKSVNLGSADDIAEEMNRIDSKIIVKKAKECVEGRYVNLHERSRIAKVALQLLGSKKDEIITFYRQHNSATAAYIARLLANETRAIDLIYQNWGSLSRTDSEVYLKSGIYQMFRRYKPHREFGGERIAPSAVDWSDNANHAVICELIYIDLDKMECVLITSKLNAYFGSLLINSEKQLFGILLRTSTRNKSIRQRFLASKMESRELPIYSGICVKTGDTTDQPVAAEFFYLQIPESHTELHKEMAEIHSQIKKGGQNGPAVAAGMDSSIAQYISADPPISPYSSDNPRWARVKFVHDFPALKKRALPDSEGVKLFREPSRAVSKEQLIEMGSNPPILEVFRHDGKNFK